MNDALAVTSSPDPEFDGRYAAEQLRRSQDPLRRFVKGFYLRHLLRDLRDLHGPCIDFGCGAGQLLALMPAGSVGIEVNPHLIAALRRAGLSVFAASATLADFDLQMLPPGPYRALVIAHVLEHLPDPVVALRSLLVACRRLGVERVVVVVPGAKGFASDTTHKTFIDRGFVEGSIPLTLEGYRRSSLSYFPGPWSWIGRVFVFHEMKFVFDLMPQPAG